MTLRLYTLRATSFVYTPYELTLFLQMLPDAIQII